MKLGVLVSGQEVVDRDESHIHGPVADLLVEAFEKIVLNDEQFKVVQVDFDRIVGKSTCVVTSSQDEIIFAKRPARFGLTRFVKNREAVPCKSIVVILKKAGGNQYVLITAFIGEKAEPEPWDRNATAKSVEFWNSHAMVWNSEPIVSGTETKVCPW